MSLAVASLRADHAIIITGLGGMPEYEENFVSWAERLQKNFSETLNADVQWIDGRTEKREAILRRFESLTRSLSSEQACWLFLIGHGNFDGRTFKFNIAGPDLTGQDLEDFLTALGERRAYVVAATSASGVLIADLSGPGRVIVSATRNERERQPPLFLSFFLQAAETAEADSNKDGKVSLLEAFLFARNGVSVWYRDKGRIQTEHPVLSDGTRVKLGGEGDEISLEEAVSAGGLLASTAYLSAPPARAYRSLEARELAEQRAVIERDIEDLKYRKPELPEAEYFQNLQELLVQLATLNEQIEALEMEP